MTEGQKVEVRFRGNLQPDEDIELVQPFNSHIKAQINMYVAEIDKYAQKSLSSYRGFAQFYVEGKARHFCCLIVIPVVGTSVEGYKPSLRPCIRRTREASK